jgi:single-stranded-DNA-specific exonuclease
MNPTRFGFDGLKDIAGSTVTYMFCEHLSPRARKLAWLPVIGMAGDILKPAQKYAAFNKAVLDMAVEEGVAELHDGLALLGGMAEPRLDGALTASIMPFLKNVAGDVAKARALLAQATLDPVKSVLAISPADARSLAGLAGEEIDGKTVLIPGREGLLHHSFEFNFLASIMGDDNPTAALGLLDKKKPSPKERAMYTGYIAMLVSNLARITSKSGTEGKSFKFIEMEANTPKQVVSDVASFTSVNGLLNSQRMLIVATADTPERVKLSFRCSPEFVKAKKTGAGTTIEQLARKFGGRGGGHDLAGGWLVSRADYTRFLEHVNDIDIIIP